MNNYIKQLLFVIINNLIEENSILKNRANLFIGLEHLTHLSNFITRKNHGYCRTNIIYWLNRYLRNPILPQIDLFEDFSRVEEYLLPVRKSVINASFFLVTL